MAVILPRRLSAISDCDGPRTGHDGSADLVGLFGIPRNEIAGAYPSLRGALAVVAGRAGGRVGANGKRRSPCSWRAQA